MQQNHAIEVRAQVITIDDDKATPVPNMPAVAMVFYVQPPADPLLIPQLAKFQTGYQLNSMARPLELLVQEAAHAALGKPRITSKEDAEAIKADAVEVSEDTLVPDGVTATESKWEWPVNEDGEGFDFYTQMDGSVVLDGRVSREMLAPIIAAQIFLIQHGRLPYVGGGKMV